MNTHKELLTMLLAVRENLPNLIKHSTYGICNEIREHCDRNGKGQQTRLTMGEILKSLWTKWPKFSGNNVYPVPSPTPEWSAFKAFCYRQKTWQGEYGANRIELLNWLIKELES